MLADFHNPFTVIFSMKFETLHTVDGDDYLINVDQKTP